MNVFLWIVAALLAAVFLGSGAMKLFQTKEKLADFGLAWTEDFSAETIKAIGSVEILAALGLILPPVLGIAPVLAPLAALGLVLLMLGAALTHLRRHEAPGIAVSVVLVILAVVVALGRFGADSTGRDHELVYDARMVTDPAMLEAISTAQQPGDTTTFSLTSLSSSSSGPRRSHVDSEFAFARPSPAVGTALGPRIPFGASRRRHPPASLAAP